MGKLADMVGVALPIMIRNAALGATADCELAVFTAKEPCVIVSAGYVPDTALTGANTTNRSLAFINKGAAGDGTTALKAAKAYNTGVNIAAMDYDELIGLSDAATLDAGETVAFKATHGSTGLALPIGLIVLYVAPRNVHV